MWNPLHLWQLIKKWTLAYFTPPPPEEPASYAERSLQTLDQVSLITLHDLRRSMLRITPCYSDIEQYVYQLSRINTCLASGIPVVQLQDLAERCEPMPLARFFIGGNPPRYLEPALFWDLVREARALLSWYQTTSETLVHQDSVDQHNVNKLYPLIYNLVLMLEIMEAHYRPA